MLRTVTLVLVSIFVFAACGGGDDDAAADPTTAATAAPDAATAEPESTTAPAPSGETTGSVTIGDETFRLAMAGGSGSCSTDVAGSGIFQAQLVVVDADGEALESAAIPGFNQTASISVAREAAGGVAASLVILTGTGDGGTWAADEANAGSPATGDRVDTASIDGNHAEGTATFARLDAEGVQTAGAPVTGTFEVTCGAE